jgi:LuxR family maltose regulon positive regulatory protein
MTNETNTFPLIRTKFNKPCIEDELIPRPHLLEQLQTGLGKKLTLISAPAGFGKTTLACMWLEQCPYPTVWLSLDEDDSNMSHFLSYLIAAIQTLFPDACSETCDLLQLSPLPPVDYIATTLINDLAALPANSSTQGFILALDDYHRINGEAVHQLLSKLIEYQPQELHLVLISRQDPTSLPLSKLRASRELLEIRSADLRFKLDETKAFLIETLGVSLPDQAIAILDKWLEGWVVGLRLASLSMRDLDDPTKFVQNLNGTDRYIMEYLVDEVLSHQPEAVQTFMLQISILNRFCGPLCEAVCFGESKVPSSSEVTVVMDVDDPVGNGQAYLEWLEQTNLFLISLDHQREWYRFHHLFQDLLISKLEAEHSAAQITELHQRASRWFADHNYIEEAIHHGLVANDVEGAVKLVENNSRNLLNRTERTALKNWLALLPEEVLWQRPKLLVPLAWLQYRQWKLTALELVLDKAEMNLEHSNDITAEEQQALYGHINTLRSVTAYQIHHDFQRSLDLARLALQQLPASESGAQGTAEGYVALAYQATGQEENGIADLGKIINDPAQSPLFKIQPFIGLFMINLLAGEYQRAHQIIRQFLTLAAEINIVTADLASNWLAGLLFFEWNDLSAAAQHFSKAEALLYRGNFLAPFSSVLGLARIHQIQNDLDGAEEMLNKAYNETLRLHNQELLPLLDAFHAYQALCRNDEAAALRWVHSLHPAEIKDAPFAFDIVSLIRARITVTYGTEDDVQATVQDLQDRLAAAEGRYFTRRVIQILPQLALAHQRLGQTDMALNLLARAVKLAQPGGAIRSFVDCGPALVPLLQQFQQKKEASSYITQLLAAFSPAPQTQSTGTGTPTSGNTDLFDLLTQRESQVLTLMQDGLTNQEIANELVISLYTVKRHATNIYNKLAVSNRRQAIRKAQELGLFSPN